MAGDFSDTFAALKRMLQRHASTLVITTDSKTDFMVGSATQKDRIGRPLFVAGVQLKKNYVSYHLMPVYVTPALLKTLSPALKKRMQGKSCFNFKTIEPPLLQELSVLTKAGIEGFQSLTFSWDRRSKT